MIDYGNEKVIFNYFKDASYLGVIFYSASGWWEGWLPVQLCKKISCFSHKMHNGCVIHHTTWQTNFIKPTRTCIL